MAPIDINNQNIDSVTVNGTDVQEITVDGDVVFTAVPDLPTTNLHANYDFSEESGTMPVQDRSGNGFDLDVGDYSGVTSTINGVQAGRFVTDDRVSIDAADYTSLSPPFTAYMVLELNNSSLRQSCMQLGAPRPLVEFRPGSDGWRTVFSGNNLDTNNFDSSYQVISTKVESSSATMMLEDNTFSTSTTGQDSTAIAIGGLDGARYIDGAIGQMLVYDDSHDYTTGIGADVLSFLSNKWGVTTV